MEPDLKELFSLESKTALVTGGAGYLGSSISYALAELGATVIIASRTLEKCQDFAEEICNELDKEDCAIGKMVDVTEIKSIKKLEEYIKNTHQGLDILVNNANTGASNSFEKMTEEEWYAGIEGSLNNYFKVSKVFFSQLKENEGVIVNNASMYGHIAPDPWIYEESEEFLNPPNYGAGKAGILQLTRYMASFLAKHNIRVNAISPGAFPSKDVQEDKEFIKRLSFKNTLNRIGKPYELKGVIALLCSEASSYINGQNICIDGGWTIN